MAVSALPVTCFMSKRDSTDLGMSFMIRSVSPGSPCDLLRSMNKYAHVFLSHNLYSPLDRHFFSFPLSIKMKEYSQKRRVRFSCHVFFSLTPSALTLSTNPYQVKRSPFNLKTISPIVTVSRVLCEPAFCLAMIKSFCVIRGVQDTTTGN